jgi:NADPH-dependent 2,4-dienoyl-CoA reductase/sulfur reductase-like enzyme
VRRAGVSVARFSRLVTYLERRLRELPVEVRLGHEVTPSTVKDLRPDVVLVAVGAAPETFRVPGAERPEVFDGAELRGLLLDGGAMLAPEKLRAPWRALLAVARALGLSGHTRLTRWLTRYGMPLGKRVAIVGGGIVGLDLARFLGERRRAVVVLEPGETLGLGMAPPRRWRALHELRERGVSLFKSARVEKIESGRVIWADASGQGHTAAADTVILALGAREDHEAGAGLFDPGAEVHRLGDCAGVGYVEGALLDGARSARII